MGFLFCSITPDCALRLAHSCQHRSMLWPGPALWKQLPCLSNSVLEDHSRDSTAFSKIVGLAADCVQTMRGTLRHVIAMAMCIAVVGKYSL